MTDYACRKCHIITGERRCPKCGEATSSDWSGYVIIIDPSKSEIAKRLNISEKGKYALRVR